MGIDRSGRRPSAVPSAPTTTRARTVARPSRVADVEDRAVGGEAHAQDRSRRAGSWRPASSASVDERRVEGGPVEADGRLAAALGAVGQPDLGAARRGDAHRRDGPRDARRWPTAPGPCAPSAQAAMRRGEDAAGTPVPARARAPGRRRRARAGRVARRGRPRPARPRRSRRRGSCVRPSAATDRGDGPAMAQRSRRSRRPRGARRAAAMRAQLVAGVRPLDRQRRVVPREPVAGRDPGQAPTPRARASRPRTRSLTTTPSRATRAISPQQRVDAVGIEVVDDERAMRDVERRVGAGSAAGHRRRGA